MVKRFGKFQFDDETRQLRVDGAPVKLSGQTLELLVLFLEQPRELVTREQIQRALWPDRTVEFDHSLDVVIGRLRAVLGNGDKRRPYIETVPRKGYRFVAPVTVESAAPPVASPRIWVRRISTYAAVALVAALAAILLAHAQYQHFIPPR